jgi:hypothetical protein
MTSMSIKAKLDQQFRDQHIFNKDIRGYISIYDKINLQSAAVKFGNES